ncbi:hypothetical protein D8M04_13500 [Oceanobacillus piezotolerans]|uniref:Replicative helicase inhibitor G39P N-terminal domain-containing protein n=1 Tax=Oceanobacillus piezotolerans TaxID=2448030 RepID=A0A498D7C0_9BACI|nr:hypothetical protein [Oceanobacillus piezotolerans]RLL43914.1 hypothetical protein D8M04_13500 [Oceanobacillus piezotolerans]
MMQKEAVEILETISEFYPTFELTKRKAKVLISHLLLMDYEGVKNNLIIYIAKSPYAPKLSDIAVYPPEPNMHLEKWKKWEEEAKKVPEEVKQNFREQFDKLLKEISPNE